MPEMLMLESRVTFLPRFLGAEQYALQPTALMESMITHGIFWLNTNVCRCRKEKARLAFAVFEGVIRGVFEIHSWHPAGTTPYYYTRTDAVGEGRWGFEGKVATKTSATNISASPSNGTSPVTHRTQLDT